MREGRYDEVVVLCAALLASVDVASASPDRNDVIEAVFRHAVALASVSDDAALGVIELVKSRIIGSQELRLKVFLGAVISFEGEIRLRRGEDVEAIGACDEALTLLSLSPAVVRRGGAVSALIVKGRALESLGRYEEAIVVLDGALSAVRAADQMTDRKRARHAAKAALLTLDVYVNLQRCEQITDLGASLSEALATLPEHPGAVTEVESGSERKLAGAVAQIINDGQCWAVFEGEQTITRADATQRAMQLYRVSEPWAFSEFGAPGAVDMAAGIVREVADGYALLALPRSESERSVLPVPKLSGLERDRALHEFGVDDWSREHGHPINLRTSDPDDPAVPKTATGADRPGWDDVEESFVHGVIRAIFEIEIADILSRSRGGRQALHDKLFTALAISNLSLARRWLQQLAPLGETDPRVGLMIVFQMAARGLFVTSHDASDDATPGLIPTDRLRDLLHETDGYEWLADHDIPLPGWAN